MIRFIIILVVMPAIAFAVYDQDKMKVLEDLGLPKPDSGVILIPKSHLHPIGKLENIREDSPRAYDLLHFDAVIKQNRLREAKMFRPNESHLRFNKDELLLAYHYSGVPTEAVSSYIGIAPAGTYVTEPQTGWSGAVEFFKSSYGTCAFTENNLQISHGAAQISEEDATYDVNGKITLKDISGTDASGYLYRVKWFDDNYIRELECASTKYSKDLLTATVGLAKAIDN